MDDADLPHTGETDNAVRARGPSRGVVLHVEDDYEVRLSTAALLNVAGFDAREAGSGESALAQADELRNKLDVLIVDYHLGDGMSGTEVAEALVRLLGHGVPTVILTGDPANAEMPWLRNSPVWLVRKPMCPLTLIAGLWPLVAFRRAIRRATPP